ncbi:Wadjet anti-phage system protein JetD domain-containing protein [Blastococcus tunisiensis]|uniref:Wadjet protein JetD C-terminal domain-containing protein n=1 Tax=Blastococcus tunisiensis TaxID=1798228 RepID=A0A1I2IUU5_9ACTN|nr:Wadjet anti-phage system protein JetD domain-containing protein [Blastococcus sp. DSM 46838]SFF45403.1 hypothetical protein SAMN05216574_11410 [Blastococcus sp. DSM 46838]
MSPARTAGWAGPSTVREALRVRWDRGDVLRELHTDPADRRVFPLRVRLPGPGRTELADRYAEATTWARGLRDAAARDGWTLEVRPVRAGGLGTQPMPYAGVVDTPELALRLLGRDRAGDAARFAAALQAANALDPAARDLALGRPHDVLGAAGDWPLLLQLAGWIRDHPRPGIHPRQIPVAGVHTKVLERNTGLLSRLLEALLPAEAVEPAARGFAARYGFVEPARRARVRGAAAALGVPVDGTADVEWDVAALAALNPANCGITELLVLENKTSFLTAPTGAGRLILWGAGYGADELLAALPWRTEVAVRYWGDIDTHGYVILARVRAVAPHATSVLMDTATLLAHRPYWSTEAAPRTDPLPHLTATEAEVYAALCAGTHGVGVRLEQEFVRFDLVTSALMS